MFETELRPDGVACISLGAGGDNLLTNLEIAALTDELERLGKDCGVKIIVLRGRGRTFCGGRDPSRDNRAGLSAYEVSSAVHGPILSAYAKLGAVRPLCVAVVQGRAEGFGAALAVACDVVLASEDATFALPEIKKDFPPTLAMSALAGSALPKPMLWCVLSARQFSACEAMDMGFLSEVLPAKEFERALDARLASLAERSSATLETLKRFSRLSPGLNDDARRGLATSMLSLAMTKDR